jgi:acyl-CoA thioesterase
LGLVVLTDMLPQAVPEGMGSTATFGVLSADHTVHLFGGTDSEWLLLGIRAHHAGDGFTSLEGTLWDETGNPLARVNQVAVLAVDH